MSNAPFTPQSGPNEPNSSKNVLRKWLPAILLAVILHLLVVIIFLVMQKDSVTSLKKQPNQSTDDHMAYVLPEDTVPIIDDKSESSKSQNLNPINQNKSIDLMSLSTLAKSKQTETLMANASNIASFTTNISALQNANLKSSADDTSSSIDKDLTKLKNDEVKRVDSRINKSNEPSIDNSNTTNTNSEVDLPVNETYQSVNGALANNHNGSNPNDGLLLSRDLPKPAKSDQLTSKTSKQYQTTSEEIEAINDKLSKTINEVKQRKMQDIERDKVLQKEAYLKDHANKNLEAVDQQNMVKQQIEIVGDQLGIDTLAETEFKEVTNQITK